MCAVERAGLSVGSADACPSLQGAESRSSCVLTAATHHTFSTHASKQGMEQPLDLASVAQRLGAGAYARPLDLAADAARMFSTWCAGGAGLGGLGLASTMPGSVRKP